MAVETIVARIAEEADAERAAVLADADRRARELVEAARAEVRMRVTTALDRAEAAIQGEEIRAVNAVRLQLLERRARRAAVRTARVFDIAERRLRRIADGEDPERWSAALGRLAREAVALAGPGAVLRVREPDAPVVGPVAETLGARLETVGPEAEPGLVAGSADGRIEVDATLGVRLAVARERLAEPVARRLGLEG